MPTDMVAHWWEESYGRLSGTRVPDFACEADPEQPGQLSWAVTLVAAHVACAMLPVWMQSAVFFQGARWQCQDGRGCFCDQHGLLAEMQEPNVNLFAKN